VKEAASALGHRLWHNRPSFFRPLPMKFAFYLLAFILAALIIPFFFPSTGKVDGVDPNSNLPWQITADGQGGSLVFGLKPGVSTLDEVKQRLGDGIEVAIIAEPNETGTLEAYYSQVALGFVLAKVIVTVDLSPEAISAMRERALKAEHMESSTRKITLSPDDLVLAGKTPIRAISVIPTVNLDEATAVQRFGEPAEKIVLSDKRTHLLYPKNGLDVVVDLAGKELLQYVAPRDFARLREPLLAAVVNKTEAQ
jgi:hypothetical protein